MYLKRFFLLLVFGLSITVLKAQNNNFFQGTMDEAKAEAKKQRKLIYVIIEMGTDESRLSPAQNDPQLVSLYNSNFICVYKNSIKRDGYQNLNFYNNVNSYPTHLFLDEKGGLILKTVGSRSNTEPYIADINKAISLAKQMTLTKFKAEYDKGERGLNFLKDYLSKYSELDIPVNQLLLNEYVSQLPERALDDYQTVLFILEQGPVVSNKAYKASRMNTKIRDSIYKTLSLERRVKMNGRIIKYSIAQAVRTRDQSLALSTANFASTTWGNDLQKSNSSRFESMMNYYRGVRDTVNYLRNAAEHYQSYYMSLRDSIQKPEAYETLVRQPYVAPPKKDTANTSRRIVRTYVTRRISNLGNGKMDAKSQARFKATEFATKLNNGAYSFYTMNSTDLDHLGKAVVWVQRSIELFPDKSEFYDTLSHLYYRQGKYDEAITTQQKAIEIHIESAKKNAEMRAKNGLPPSIIDTSMANNNKKVLEQLTNELNKIKSRTL